MLEPLFGNLWEAGLLGHVVLVNHCPSSVVYGELSGSIHDKWECDWQESLHHCLWVICCF